MNAPLRSAATASVFASLLALPAFAAADDSLARVRVIHASPDTPSVDVLANDTLAIFTSLQFGDVTGYAEVPANVYDVKVVPAGAGPGAAAIQADLNLFYGTDYTVLAIDTLDNVRPLVLVDDNEATDSSLARVRFVHAVPDAPAVDLKVADGPFLFQNIAFESAGDYVSVPTNAYGLELRVAGTDIIALELSDIALAGGATYTILATGLLANGSLDTIVVEDSRQAERVTPLPQLPTAPVLDGQPRRFSPLGN